MSQVTFSNTERVCALMTYGYTERESSFLCLTALLAGYFLRRHFCQYLGREVGGTAAALVDKLQQKKHAIVLTGSHNTRIYHLSARSLYAALGQEDNRNRRSREPLAIQRRLMILDFVLDHPSHRYFATEQEKLDFFAVTRGLPLSVLPSKHYRSPSTGQVTMRYFVDKNPIFVLTSDHSVQPLVHFCYVDEAVTLSGFETFLGQYRSLFDTLGRFRVVYVAASSLPGFAAEKAFERFVSRSGARRTDGNPESVRSRLKGYFAIRQRYDNGQLDGFDRDRLIQLRDDRQRFSGKEDEILYERWKQVGDAAFDGLASRDSSSIPFLDASFTVHVLKHPYAIFGSLEGPTNES